MLRRKLPRTVHLVGQRVPNPRYCAATTLVIIFWRSEFTGLNQHKSNVRKNSNLDRDIAQWPVSDNSSQKTRKIKYQAFLVLSSFTGFLYFVSNILSGIVVHEASCQTCQFVSSLGRKINQVWNFRRSRHNIV